MKEYINNTTFEFSELERRYVVNQMRSEDFRLMGKLLTLEDEESETYMNIEATQRIIQGIIDKLQL